jgi:hypothetical protein
VLLGAPPEGVDARAGVREGEPVGVDAPSRPGAGGFFAVALDMAARRFLVARLRIPQLP